MKAATVYVPAPIAPEELISHILNRALGEAKEHGTISMLDHIEDTAMRRLALSEAHAEPGQPGIKPDPATWRAYWLDAAYMSCKLRDQTWRCGFICDRDVEAAVNTIVGVDQLRQAVADQRATDVALLAMLLIGDVMQGGYSMEMEEVATAAQAMERAKRALYEKGVGLKAPAFASVRASCIESARRRWATDPTLRIGEMAASLRGGLIDAVDQFAPLELKDIPKEATIKGWLRSAAAAGRLEMPPQAQQPGRPLDSSN